MSYFECIPLKTPKSGCDGAILARYDSQEFVVLWREKEAYFQNISFVSRGDNAANVLTLNTNIKTVFQLGENVCCLGSNSFLYKLRKSCKDVDRESYESGDEDIFGSGDSADDSFQVSEMQFTFTLPLKNVINICALSKGFAIVVEMFGKLFIEAYNISDSLTKPEKIFSEEIPFISSKILNQNECVLVAIKQQKLARDVVGVLLGDMILVDVEIIFIGFMNGQVFYVPCNKTAHAVKLLYSSFHQVTNILFLQGGTHMKLVIALEPGLIIEVRFSEKLPGHLEYATSYLPGTIRSSCAVGGYLLVGNGNWLWCLQPEGYRQSVNAGASAGRGTQIDQLAVRGTKLLCVRDDQTAFAITVHGTTYKLSLQLLSEGVPSVSECDIQPDLSLSLKQQLNLLEDAEKNIVNEDKFISAVGLAMHSELLKSCFSMIITVHDVTSRIPTEFFQELTTGPRGFHKDGKYIFDICLQNSSDEEFFSDVWFIHISIKSENQTLNSVVHFNDVFKRGCDVNTTVCTDIENVAALINVSSTLVCKMPPLQSSKQTDFPSLFIPVDNVTLSIGYFLTPLLSLSEDIQNITLLPNSSELGSLLPKIRENYAKCSENLSDIPFLEKDYAYKIILPKRINKDLLWSQIFKRSIHRCSGNVLSWFQSSVERTCVEQTLWVRAGQHLCKMTLCAGYSAVQVQSKDPETLHSIKNYIMEEMQAIYKCTSNVKIPSTVRDAAKSVRVNLDIERHHPTMENLERIRREWRASVIEKLPP